MATTSPKAPRRPPLDATFARLLAAVDRGQKDALREGSATARKAYVRGLPRGLDPERVAAVVCAWPPVGDEIRRLTKIAGTTYDAAVVEGARRHRARHGVAWVLELMLIAALAEHGGASVAEAYGRLRRASELVGRDPSTNCPSDRRGVALDRVADAMAPWLAPALLVHTLALAGEGLGPTRWSNGDRSGATAPQCDEDWALFIACSLHPSDAASAVIASRAPLIPLLDGAGRDAVLDVLRHARGVNPHLSAALGASP